MDNDNDQLPQKMSPAKGPRFRPYQKPGTAGQTVADIERQEKIERLRAEEDDKKLFGIDRDDQVAKTPGNGQATKPKKKHRFLRFMGWMLLIVALTAGGAAAGWHFWLRKEAKPTQTQTAQTEKPAIKPAEVVEPTDTHTSATFQIQFDHPQTWKVTDNPDNTVTATSPALQLKIASANGSSKKQTGQVLLTIRHKQASLPEFKTGNAMAARESEKITYAKPSQVQRASTYISFLNFAGATTKGIDAVYVTGDNGYQKDQAIPLVDVAKSDPLITLTFRGCIDATCKAAGENVALAVDAWGEPVFTNPLERMLQSIVAE